VAHIPDKLVQSVKVFIGQNYPKFNVTKKSKWQCLRFAAEKLQIDTEKLFFHGQQRGIYVGFTSSNSREFLLKTRQENLAMDKLKSLDEISNFWKIRWAKQRFEHQNKLVKSIMN
jgi:hypothetical protein